MTQEEKRFCDERHRHIDVTMIHIDENMIALFKMHNRLLWAIIGSMAVILMAVCGVLLSQVQMRGDLQRNSAMAQAGERQAHSDAEVAHADLVSERNGG